MKPNRGKACWSVREDEAADPTRTVSTPADLDTEIVGCTISETLVFGEPAALVTG